MFGKRDETVEPIDLPVAHQLHRLVTEEGFVLGASRAEVSHRVTLDMLRDAMRSLTPSEIMQQVIEHMAGRPDLCGTELERHSDQLRRVAWSIQRGES